MELLTSSNGNIQIIAVNGSLDLYQFDQVPDSSQLALVETRNRPDPVLGEDRAPNRRPGWRKRADAEGTLTSPLPHKGRAGSSPAPGHHQGDALVHHRASLGASL